MRPRAILTDIEGTTTSVSFVYDVLFPYARAHLGEFVRANADRPSVQAELAAVSQEVAREVGRELTQAEAIEQLLAWMDEDRKVTPLKSLQGMIWQAGYAAGGFTGHIYPDAYDQLQLWQQQGLALYVYSSGSVAAQRLLFGYSDFGDMRPLFSGYFDTRMGGKREADSYLRIAAEIGLPAGEILFLSDIPGELDAAREAGMKTAWLVREGALDAEAGHAQYSDFKGIA